MPRKPKTNQSENVEEISGRDLFQTPCYAVDLLVPFLQQFKHKKIWECAAGLGKIVRRLQDHNFDIYGSDLQSDDFPQHNFLTQSNGQDFDVTVTNPPFSLKKKFYEQCIRYGRPFSLLIPADYSGWVISAIKNHKAEKIIPTRRIDYITPDVLQRIWMGETWKVVQVEYDIRASDNITMQMFIDSYPIDWKKALLRMDKFNFSSIYSAPAHLLRKYSACQFHSMWLTWGFGLGKSETFVELTNEMKNNI